jgi:hypothetical protein
MESQFVLSPIDNKTAKDFMACNSAYTVLVKEKNGKQIREFHIHKDRYSNTAGEVLTEIEFIEKFTPIRDDVNLYKRFMNYIKEHEPEYMV